MKRILLVACIFFLTALTLNAYFTRDGNVRTQSQKNVFGSTLASVVPRDLLRPQVNQTEIAQVDRADGSYDFGLPVWLSADWASHIAASAVNGASNTQEETEEKLDIPQSDDEIAFEVAQQYKREVEQEWLFHRSIQSMAEAWQRLLPMTEVRYAMTASSKAAMHSARSCITVKFSLAGAGSHACCSLWHACVDSR